MLTIDDIVLLHDTRGISSLRDYVEGDNALKTAEFCLGNMGAVMITTGFYVKGFPETDGPPGAILLAWALKGLGCKITIVSDRDCLSLMRNVVGDEFELIEFPISNFEESQKYASELLNGYHPSLMISTERCGMTKDHVYKNMRGIDISDKTARIDLLFLSHPATIGIGDGGNEIGMGLLHDQIKHIPSLVSDPAITKTTKLIIASVSNWGCYGLLTALSEMVNKELLPPKQECWELVKSIVDAGGVDGFSGEREYKVDGFGEEVDGEIADLLHRYLSERLV
jgi:hypothetical protein